MKIRKIEKCKNNKYKLYIEDDIIMTYDDVILENNLLYKTDIENNLYNKIINDTKYYDIYNKALKYISKKRRSKKEMIKYLEKFSLSTMDINSIIKKLEDINLINDLEYCRAFINDSVYLSKKGINKIKIELLENNIPIEIIEDEFSKVDYNIINARLEKMIVKRINSNKKYSNYELKYKILNEMINMGYSKQKILEIIENNLSEDNSIIKKEYDKLYNKYKVKYSTLELNNKIKQKLLSKGFKLDDINNLFQ